MSLNALEAARTKLSEREKQRQQNNRNLRSRAICAAIETAIGSANESSVDEMVNAVESGAITEQELQSIGEATIEYTELELLLGQSEKIHREIHEALETKAREVEKWQERLKKLNEDAINAEFRRSELSDATRRFAAIKETFPEIAQHFGECRVQES